MVSPALAVVAVAVVVALLACSAFFSSSEIAIFSLPRSWIDEAAASDERVRALQDLVADPHRLLVTILVGNNVVNIAISSIVTVLATSYLPPGPAVLVATLVTSVVILLFGEVLPKSVGLGNARTVAVAVVPVLRVVEAVLSPVVAVFDWVTRRLRAYLGTETAIEKPYVD